MVVNIHALLFVIVQQPRLKVTKKKYFKKLLVCRQAGTKGILASKTNRQLLFMIIDGLVINIITK